MEVFIYHINQTKKGKTKVSNQKSKTKAQHVEIGKIVISNTIKK